MSAPYSGECMCGAIALEITGKPVATRQCWCRQCQKIAVGGPTNNAIFKAEDVRISGKPAESSWPAASGNTLTFRFCAQCGTQIYAQSSARPHLMTVRIGALTVDCGLKPDTAIWTEEAPDWAVIDPSIEAYPQQAPLAPRSS